MTDTHTPGGEVVLAEQGALARITLNRPKALNSLTLGMVRTITSALREWEGKAEIRAVLIEGAGERGLCAGGDVRALYDAAVAGDDQVPATFWREEYWLNAYLARYPKPIVAIMDGITMGGGVGISAHVSHRVVTERVKVAMPEVGIGFVPDVGGTYLLSHAPGELGTHLALTGTPVGAGDAINCGLADHFVPTSALNTLISGLSSGDVEGTLSTVRAPAPDSRLDRSWIDQAYAASTVEEILRRLRTRPEEAASAAVQAIETKSPTSLKVTLRTVRVAGDLSLEQALAQEFRAAMASIRVGDFVEGVRATLVDKDRTPKWSPDRLEDVSDDLVAQFFEAPPGVAELDISA